MPDFSKRIIYLSDAQRQELFTNDTITVDGVTITYNENDIYVTPQSEPVTDVQVNGTSILNNGVANVPISNQYRWGATQIASSTRIKPGSDANRAICPWLQHESTFYGLAKAAGADMASSSNAVGVYTDDAKKKIRKMLGAASGEWELITNVTVSEDTESLDILTDANGQPFKLSKIHVRAWLEPSTTGTADFISANNNVARVSGQNTYSASPTVKYMANGAKTFFEYQSEIICGVCYSFGSASSVPASTTSVNKISSNLDDIAYIRGFKLSKYGNATSLIPKDSIITIYGIRIDE